jgi:ABC-type proline/glycine betaine transport system substrate-binding protein
VPWDAWFPHVPASEDEELFELTAKIDEKGTMMSVLWAPSYT